MVNSRSKSHSIVPAMCLALMSAPTAALTPLPEPGIAIGAHVEQFHYRERNASGQQLNREKGILQGIAFSAGKEVGPLSVGVFASRTKGTVDYEGQTQAGRPLNTDTREAITRYGFSLKGPEWELSQVTLAPYGVAGYSQWNRSILATDFSSALTEKYRWWHLAAGVQTCTQHAGTWCLRTGVTHTFNGNMTIDLQSLGAGQPELELKPETGGEIALGWTNEPFSVQIYYREWGFGASDPKLVRGQRLLLEIMEPASKTRVTGLAGGIRF